MCPPGEGDFLPSVNNLPPRPSTMPAPAPMAAPPVAPVSPPSFVPPAFVQPVATADQIVMPAPAFAPPTAVPGQTLPPPPGAGDNMVMPPEIDPQGPAAVNTQQAEPPRRRGRRRAADAAEQQAAVAVPLPPVGMPLTMPPPPVFGEPGGTMEPAYPAPNGTIPSEMPSQPQDAAPVLQVQASSAGLSEQAREAIPATTPGFSQSQLMEPRFHVGLGTTVNLGNFENVKYDIGVSGIPVSSSVEQLSGLMSSANARASYVMDILGAALFERVKEVKEVRGIE